MTAALCGAAITLPLAQQKPIPRSATSASPHALFSEGFDDPGLLQRGWYDGSKFTISDAQPHAGKGCIEYAWKAGATTPSSSPGIRHLFEPTDTVCVPYYFGPGLLPHEQTLWIDELAVGTTRVGSATTW